MKVILQTTKAPNEGKYKNKKRPSVMHGSGKWIHSSLPYNQKYPSTRFIPNLGFISFPGLKPNHLHWKICLCKHLRACRSPCIYPYNGKK